MADRTFSNAHCTAAATDRGATITSWHPTDAHEALFVTRAANPDAEFHGGIPICAPWFARGRDGVDVPRPHGLVRWVDWRFEGARQERDATVAAWTLDAADTAHLPGAERYPSDLHYRAEARFGRELHLSLTITSPTQETIVDEAFHSYFLVNAVSQATVTGVGDEPLVVTGHHDAIYPDAADGGVTITLPDREITIATDGARDVVVWNPGPERAAELADFDGADWPRMLCVEVGNVRQHAVTIPAGGSHTMAMTLTIS